MNPGLLTRLPGLVPSSSTSKPGCQRQILEVQTWETDGSIGANVSVHAMVRVARRYAWRVRFRVPDLVRPRVETRSGAACGARQPREFLRAGYARSVLGHPHGEDAKLGHDLGPAILLLAPGIGTREPHGSQDVTSHGLHGSRRPV